MMKIKDGAGLFVVGLPIKHQTNTAAIQILEAALAEARTGNIIDVSISWVTSEMAIGGDFSGGGNNIMMWASIEHSARSFYSDIILDTER